MSIFTEDAKKEVKRFLPHYIVGSGFLVLSILLANLISHAMIYNLQNPNSNPARNHETIIEEIEGSQPLPSEFDIGLPYEEAIKDKTKPLVLEFFADWCPSSKRLTPVFAEVSESLTDFNFSTIDTQIEENYYLSQKYKVDKFPFIVVIDTKSGEFLELFLKDHSFTKEGLSKQIEELVDELN